MTQTAHETPGTTGPDAGRNGRRRRHLIPHLLAGILAAAIFLGVADLIAQLFGPASSPLVSLGSTIITLSPSWLQDFAISFFGSNNKLVLYLSMGIVGMILAALIGAVARRSLRLGVALVAVVAAILLMVVLLRPESSPLDALPTIIGAGLGIFSLLLLSGAATGLTRAAEADRSGSPLTDSRPAETRRSAATRPSTEDEHAHSRRRFLGLAAAGTAIAAGSITFGRSVNAFGVGAGEAAARLVLPTPAVPAAAIPAGASVGVDGVAPFITPNNDFYRIDTALVVPELAPDDWTLRIHGLVEEEITIDMAELLDLPLEEHHITLACVSNPVGGDLLGNATWLGYPIRELLARARPLGEADMVLSRSVDGWTASTPLEVLTDEDRACLLAVGMNGEPLPAQHGYPARLVVPGLYGYVSATKWVTELEVTRFDAETAYWTDRGWDAEGPILVASRIDVPRPLARVSSGEEVVVAGSAWAQHEGVSEVEVRLDDGDWESVELADEVNIDTWRQWRHTFADVDSGRHSVTVRAINAAGETQTDERRDPIPNAATGQHRIEFSVE
ncbi:molybdopterin-dependent oxidoreductase [Nesterenkonia sandarakina]|uniref:DMSO/TMAO reductase YedYZ molybdopterin-dependent catalytic subunit n=1 Tax=Nesterenkonia sandarakina TaxID=272918 RepID=A0A2T0YQ63_9MICC|nr:molybdopterin-dependent oxidoreductase [Nesterenkonia sandarakina]PRZ17551.1 DMSO/TMAO reductase YedYZ molybdopterin-dependent catalytic subunit [Nesterenkonia sandarakina]